MPRAARAGKGDWQGRSGRRRAPPPSGSATDELTRASCALLSRPSGITAPGLPCAPAQGAPAEGPRSSRCPPRAPSPPHSRRSLIPAPARAARPLPPSSPPSSPLPPPPLASRLPSSPAHPLPAPSSLSQRSLPTPTPTPTAASLPPRGARRCLGRTRLSAGRRGPSPHRKLAPRVSSALAEVGPSLPKSPPPSSSAPRGCAFPFACPKLCKSLRKVRRTRETAR